MNNIIKMINLIAITSALFSAPLLRAQESAVVKGVSQATKIVRTVKPSVKVPTVRLPSTSVPTLPSVNAPTLPAVKVPDLPAVKGPTSIPTITSSIPTVPSETIQANLEQQMEKLRQQSFQIEQYKQILSTEIIPRDAYIFQAIETREGIAPTNIFSGTVVATEFNGSKETYGVVATHTIATDTMEKDALHRHFTAIFYKNGIPYKVPVEIVAFSPKSMYDIALVKFPDEIENFLVPYSIATEEPKLHENLTSLGFTHQSATTIPNREVLDITPISIRTTISVPPENRPGLCGSAVLNENHELTGIHTGSVADVSYATPAHFINNLVASYHGENVTMPFMLDNEKLFDLEIDEYIASAAILDETGTKQLAIMNFDSKFSYLKLKNTLAQKGSLNSKLQFTTRRALWSEDGSALIENRKSTDKSIKTTYVYDLASHKLISKKLKVYNPTTGKVDKIDVPL